MLGFLSEFFAPKEISDYFTLQNREGKVFWILFEDGSKIEGIDKRIKFSKGGINTEIMDRKLFRWLWEILQLPNDKFKPYLISGAIKLFAITNGLMEYDFTDASVRDVIRILEV